MNPIEEAVQKGDVAVEAYLGDVSAQQFKWDVEDLKKKYSNKGAISDAITKLQELL